MMDSIYIERVLKLPHEDIYTVIMGCAGEMYVFVYNSKTENSFLAKQKGGGVLEEIDYLGRFKAKAMSAIALVRLTK